MFMTLKTESGFADTQSKDIVNTVQPGRYEIVEVPNPRGHAAPWLVIKGTTIGKTQLALLGYSDPCMEEYQITFEGVPQDLMDRATTDLALKD